MGGLWPYTTEHGLLILVNLWAEGALHDIDHSDINLYYRWAYIQLYEGGTIAKYRHRAMRHTCCNTPGHCKSTNGMCTCSTTLHWKSNTTFSSVRKRIGRYQVCEWCNSTCPLGHPRMQVSNFQFDCEGRWVWNDLSICQNLKSGCLTSVKMQQYYSRKVYKS